MDVETNEYNEPAIQVYYSEYVPDKVLHVDFDPFGWPLFTLIEV